MAEEEQFLTLIDGLLQNTVSFNEFKERFVESYGYADHVLNIPTPVASVLSEVLEKLTWSDEAPTPFERKHGWITADEFVKWMRDARETLR
jgi:hypothetical protein